MLEAFVMLGYRKMLKIIWLNLMKSEEVLRIMNETRIVIRILQHRRGRTHFKTWCVDIISVRRCNRRHSETSF